MEKLSTETSTTKFDLKASPTTAKDIPYDCMELVMERLALVDHYKAWDCLMKRPSIRASPFRKYWFLQWLGTTGSRSYNDPKVGDCCSMSFSEQLLGKEQWLFLELDHQTQIGKESEKAQTAWRPVKCAVDKGLMLFGFHDTEVRNSKSDTRSYKFVVLNPINKSLSALPPIPDPLCKCDLGCFCEVLPLKLTVRMGQEGGHQTSTASSSYKAYVVESKSIPIRFRRKPRYQYNSRYFRVIHYDSMTKLWTPTDAQWISSLSDIQMFLTRDALFISTRGSQLGLYDNHLEFLYKFQDGILVGKVKPPYKLKWEDRHCDWAIGDIVNDYHCGCITTTVFEAEGKIFLFQQTSDVGSFGPSCMSATIWELDDRAMIWMKLHDLPTHRFEFCPRPPGCTLYRQDSMFRYEGVLVVVHCQSSDADFHHIACFDIFKKVWCKVPDFILQNPQYYNGGRGEYEAKIVLFEPNAHTRA